MNTLNITTLALILKECLLGHSEKEIAEKVSNKYLNTVLNTDSSSSDTELFLALDLLIGDLDKN